MPAKGLTAGGLTNPIDLPGVVLAGVAGLGFGLVLGPEGPLLALVQVWRCWRFGWPEDRSRLRRWR